jgi:hypothetical protein
VSFNNFFFLNDIFFLTNSFSKYNNISESAVNRKKKIMIFDDLYFFYNIKKIYFVQSEINKFQNNFNIYFFLANQSFFSIYFNTLNNNYKQLYSKNSNYIFLNKNFSGNNNYMQANSFSLKWYLTYFYHNDYNWFQKIYFLEKKNYFIFSDFII